MVFVVMGLNSHGNERWQVGGSGYSSSEFIMVASGNNSSIHICKNDSNQCGKSVWSKTNLASWVTPTFNSDSRMLILNGNGNALSSSTSGTVHLRENSEPINQSYSVRIEHYQPSESCSNHYECAVVFFFLIQFNQE